MRYKIIRELYNMEEIFNILRGVKGVTSWYHGKTIFNIIRGDSGIFYDAKAGAITVSGKKRSALLNKLDSLIPYKEILEN
jgi:hypothetical protein